MPPYTAVVRTSTHYYHAPSDQQRPDYTAAARTSTNYYQPENTAVALTSAHYYLAPGGQYRSYYQAVSHPPRSAHTSLSVDFYQRIKKLILAFYESIYA
jgi:hypothetical protein